MPNLISDAELNHLADLYVKLKDYKVFKFVYPTFESYLKHHQDEAEFTRRVKVTFKFPSKSILSTLRRFIQRRVR